MQVILVLIFLGFSGKAQDIKCLECMEGVQLCIVDVTQKKYEYVQRKCENYICTECFRVGFAQKRFAYKIYNEASSYEFHGFSLFYQDSNKCESDRADDMRCH